MEVDDGSNQNSDIQPHWMAAHARLKNEFMEDEKCLDLMSWLNVKSQGMIKPCKEPHRWLPIFFYRNENEPSQEIAALSVLCKLILQMCMPSHPEGLDV